MVTSGPGTSNLATGLVTANAESDPVVALAGAVPRTDRLKRTHQSMDNAALFEPITKYSVEVSILIMCQKHYQMHSEVRLLQIQEQL